MWETFLSITLFGSFVWWAIITAVILFIFISSELQENGYLAFIGAVVYLIVFYFWGDQELGFLLDWKHALIYLGIGLVYTTLRTLILGNESRIKVNEYISNPPSFAKIKTKEDATQYKKSEGRELINNLSGNVSRWCFLWPISLIIWLLVEKLADFWKLIWRNIHGIFESIFRLGFGDDDDVEFDEKL